MNAFLERPIEGEWPYLWPDATYVEARRDHRIVSVAVIIAVAVNTDGRREVSGMVTGNSEAEHFWTGFLRGLARRGLCPVAWAKRSFARFCQRRLDSPRTCRSKSPQAEAVISR